MPLACCVCFGQYFVALGTVCVVGVLSVSVEIPISNDSFLAFRTKTMNLTRFAFDPGTPESQVGIGVTRTGEGLAAVEAVGFIETTAVNEVKSQEQ